MLFRFFYTNILRLGITTQYVCLYGKFILNTHSKERKTQKMSVGIFFFFKKTFILHAELPSSSDFNF